MTATQLHAEVQRLIDIIDNPESDNTAGRVELLKYDILPKLLVSERLLVLKGLKALLPNEQLQLHI